MSSTRLESIGNRSVSFIVQLPPPPILYSRQARFMVRLNANNILVLKPTIMAEIHVQPKKHSSSIWLWVLLVLIVLAVVYFLTRNNGRVEKATDGMNTTSFLYSSASSNSLYRV